MGIDLSTGKSIHEALLSHLGHEIVCAAYYKEGCENDHTNNRFGSTAIECRTCGEVLVSGSDETPEVICPAEVHTDDFAIELPFDAEFFFRTACDNDIRALIECDWRGDYPADEVAIQCAKENGDIDVVLEYGGDSIGYEVSVDEEKALKYLWDRRPSLMREIESQAREMRRIEPEGSNPIDVSLPRIEDVSEKKDAQV